jgi:hypothetical protein
MHVLYHPPRLFTGQQKMPQERDEAATLSVRTSVMSSSGKKKRVQAFVFLQWYEINHDERSLPLGG